MSLGNTLRTARESLGITTSELAARTHMLVQIVEGLENEDFRRIPAPIYGRGFIKLYCEAVNLDPKPLQAEFMQLYSRAKEAPEKTDPFPSRPRRQEAPPPPPVPEREIPPEQPIQPEQPLQPEQPIQPEQPLQPEQPEIIPEPADQANDFGELFAQPAQPASPAAPLSPAAHPTASDLRENAADSGFDAPPKRSYGDLFGQAYADDDDRPAKQSAAEKFRDTMSNVSSGVFANVQKLPPNTGRIVAVSALAVIVLVFIGWGVSALYKATTPGEADVPVADEAVTEAPKTDKQEAEKPEAEKQEKAKEEKQEAKKQQTAKGATKSVPAADPEKLRSSGIDIPALYID